MSWKSRPFTLALVAIGLWAYAGSFDGVLFLDDLSALTFNPSIRTIGTSLSPPPGTSLSGRPIANLTFAINYALAPSDARDVFAPTRGADDAMTDAFRRNIRGYHAVNLAIHLCASLALFGIVRRTFLTPSLASRFGSAASWLAFGVSAIWVVHPLQTEAVTYLVQRVESLMGLLCLFTVYCAIRVTDCTVQRRRVWTAAAVISCALGMATKEAMVVAPVLVWLWYRTFVPAAVPRRVIYLLCATWLVLLPLVLSNPRGSAAGLVVEGWTPWTYLLTQTGVILHYIQLTFRPSPLILHYAWPKALSLADVVVPAALIAALVLLTIVAVVRRHPLGFAGAWFFGVLAPTSSVVPIITEVAAEHRLYLPSAAIIAVVAACAYALGSRMLSRGEAIGRVAGLTSVLAVVIFFGTATRTRNLDYADDERLWRGAVEAQPDSPRAQLSYGLILVGTGRFGDAESHLRLAAALEPMNPLAHRTLGLSLAGQEKYREALVEMNRSLELFPEDPVVRRAIAEISRIVK